MRIKLKYKIYKQLKFTKFEKLPLRILKFKRPCWSTIQQRHNKKQSIKILFQNNISNYNSLKKWFFLRKAYSNSLLLKRLYYKMFDFGITSSFLKRYKNIKNRFDFITLFKYFLIIPYYRIDILLNFLNFYNSIYHAQQDIYNKKILINNNTAKFNYILQKGDVIKFTEIKVFNKFKNLLLEKQISNIFLTFLEVDYYTKSIIILKNISELNIEDIFLIQSNFFEFKKFFDHIKLK